MPFCLQQQPSLLLAKQRQGASVLEMQDQQGHKAVVLQKLLSKRWVNVSDE